MSYTYPVGTPDALDTFGGVSDPVRDAVPDPAVKAPGWYEVTPRVNSKAAGDDFDCYYVDNGHPSATDSGNPYGRPGLPRATIPNLKNYTAGAYVQIHGGGSNYSTTFKPGGLGTSAAPIWFVGIDSPVITAYLDIGSTNLTEIGYMYFDGLEWFGLGTDMRPRFANNAIHHIVFRDCHFDGNEVHGAGVSAGASFTTDPTQVINDILLYNCQVENFGNPDAPNEECGVYPVCNLTRFWFLDGRVNNNAEDAFGGSHGGKHTTSGYYIGRSEIDSNITNAVDLKGIGTTIISECYIHDHFDIWNEAGTVQYSSGQGESIAAHYGGPSSNAQHYPSYPTEVVIILNRIEDGRYALATSNCGKIIFALNLVSNVHALPSGYTEGPYSSGQKTEAVYISGVQENQYITHNTFFGCDGGIRVVDGAPSYSAVATYYQGFPVTVDNVRYVCINDADDAGIVGISPPNATYWKPIRLTIWGNIFAGRTKTDQADIRIGIAAFATSALDMDHNCCYCATGEQYQYGSTDLRDLAWMQANTPFEQESINTDPQFTDAGAGDFTIPTGSPCKNAATEGPSPTAYEQFEDDHGMDIRRSFNLGVRPVDAWDMGAHEFGATAPEDTTPPSPNPSTIDSVTVDSDTQITVVATTAVDAVSPPVEYNHAIDDVYAGWQSSATRVFSGLTANTLYSFRVRSRDAEGNTTTQSIEHDATTETAPSDTGVPAVRRRGGFGMGLGRL